jgi:hypothetical protein
MGKKKENQSQYQYLPVAVHTTEARHIATARQAERGHARDPAIKYTKYSMQSQRECIKY